MSKTADKKDVLKRLNRIKKNRFFTRMVLFLGTSAITLGNPGASDRAGASVNANFSKGIVKSFANLKLNSLDKEKEINKRVDWFFDTAVDSLQTQYQEFTSLKNIRKKNKVIEDKFFNDMNLVGGTGGRDYYCLAATLSNYARLSRTNSDLDSIIPDINNSEPYTKAHCQGFISFMQNKAKSEFNNKFVIKSRNLNKEIDSIGKGAILLVEASENTSSGYHAITYIGKDENGSAQFMSYNREVIAPLKHWSKSGVPVKGVAIDLPGMAKESWHKKTENCNKMEFLAMLYNGRQKHVEPEFYSEKVATKTPILGSAFDASSLFVKTAPVWHPAALPMQKNKKHFNPAALLAKNKIVLKRKFSLASRWVKKKSINVPERLESFFDEQKIQSAGRTFDSTQMFANYKYQTTRG